MSIVAAAVSEAATSSDASQDQAALTRPGAGPRS
jgi:hypothetical protein